MSRISVHCDDPETRSRFRDMKEGARERMGGDYLTNEDFVDLLLDVYDLHLDDEGGGSR